MFKNLESVDRETVDLFRRMAIMAEYNYRDVRNHIERIRGISFIIAKNIELTAQNAEGIAVASMLHDIGKVGLPPELSIKSDKFTSTEFEAIKLHVSIAADILNGSPSPLVQMAQLIALSHHERWDGTGYPDGLKGSDIPLAGRIVAVADVFDALTTHRSYKSQVSVDKAFQLLREASGKLFDPQIVDIFLDKSNEILNYRQNHL